MSLFNDFSKLEVRTETIPEKSDLEKILDIEEEIIKRYENDKQFEMYFPKKEEAYQLLYNTAKEKLKNVEINSRILQEYIDARDNTKENTSALIRGEYSAALLEIICTEKPEEYIFIDGRGKTFNYLFYHTKQVKNLTLINVNGNYILTYAGCNRGSATYVSLYNITGKWTLGNSGMYDGNATHITLNKITGYGILACCGQDGTARHITLLNIKGNNTFSDVAWNNGKVEYVILNNISGELIFSNGAGHNGKINNVALKNINGLGTLVNNKENKKNMENILEEFELTKPQKKILSQIQLIVETIHTLPLEEQTKAHDEIAQLQTEIFTN